MFAQVCELSRSVVLTIFIILKQFWVASPKKQAQSAASKFVFYHLVKKQYKKKEKGVARGKIYFVSFFVSEYPPSGYQVSKVIDENGDVLDLPPVSESEASFNILQTQ